MAYYMRAFCTSSKVPSLNEVFGWSADRKKFKSEGIEFALDPIVEVEPTSSEWNQAALRVMLQGESVLDDSLLVDVDRDDGNPTCLFHEEVEEFIEMTESDFINNPDATQQHKEAGKRIIDHLKQSKYVVSCQIPSSELDDEGHYEWYSPALSFLRCFVQYCGGIVQTDDGEWFFPEDFQEPL